MLKDPNISREFLAKIKEFQFNTKEGIDTSYADFVAKFKDACEFANLQPMSREQKRIPWEDANIRRLRSERAEA